MVRRYRSIEEERAALAVFHANSPGLARLIGEFGALLLAGHLTAVPDARRARRMAGP
ncbi:hypothetical protein ABT354_23275 [Streptomyces sp. NPDC000594]|uniref:hypothetical protein n=1 Tax=Streptomyces sp. NPDC000594 TaxID=3154261 RepID=UPI0033215B65